MLEEYDRTLNFLRVSRKKIDPITFNENLDVASYLDDYFLEDDFVNGSRTTTTTTTILHNTQQSSKLQGLTSSPRSSRSQSPKLVPSLRKKSSKKGHKRKERPQNFSVCENVEVFLIPDDLEEVSWEDLFYSSEDISNMRHEAFLESCGLSIHDFED